MSNWINVKDRLPDTTGPVLETVLVWDNQWKTQYHSFWNGEEWEQGAGREPVGNITHWMPTPEPPSENNNETK